MQQKLWKTKSKHRDRRGAQISPLAKKLSAVGNYRERASQLSYVCGPCCVDHPPMKVLYARPWTVKLDWVGYKKGENAILVVGKRDES